MEAGVVVLLGSLPKHTPLPFSDEDCFFLTLHFHFSLGPILGPNYNVRLISSGIMGILDQITLYQGGGGVFCAL